MVLDMQTLQRRRTSQRNRVDHAINTAQTVLDGPTLSPAQLQGQINLIQRLQTTLDDYDMQILDLYVEADDIDVEVTESGGYQDRLILILTTLQESKAEILSRNDADGSDAGAPTVRLAGGNPQPAAAADQGHASISRLPQLELPKFSGDPLQWSSFWDSFESAIHNNARLSAVDKFNYLRSLLKGLALDAIAGIAITNANYPTAINLIQTRFGQQQAIISAHVEALVNLPKATDDTSKLRSLYDAAEIHIRELETFNITAAQNGAILTPILLTKVPDDIRLIITRNNGAPIADLDLLRHLLRTEIEARELSMLTKKPSSAKPFQRDTFNEFTAGSLFNSTSNGYCRFCEQSGHLPSDCSQYPTVKERQAKVWSDKLCGNCLSPNHHQSECRSKYNCRLCNKKHHTSLCRNLADSTGSQNYPSNKKSWPPKNRNGKKTNVSVASTETSEGTHPLVKASPTLLSNSSSVWMQTAIAMVPDATGKLHTARLLFDSGSDRSYVTKSFAEQLSLKTVSTEVLSIAAFGQKRSSTRCFDVTDFECTDSNVEQYHRLTAVIVPTITCPIFRAKLKSPSSVFKNLRLADPPKETPEWSTTDILIGLDHYWELIHDQIIRLPEEGLIAMSSVFGWLVSGTMRLDYQRHQQSNALFIASNNCPDDNFLTKFWDSESLEFSESTTKNSLVQHDSVLRRFDNTIKVLGIPWDITKDSLQIKGVPTVNEAQSPTKRLILQTIAKVFDPMGLASPVVIRAKMFIQSLWKIGLEWDAVPPKELLNEWSEIVTQLSLLNEVKVARRVNLKKESELHVFVDASSKAYAAVAYLRTPMATGFSTSLVCSKSRVAPVKSVTIPRLELMAALVGCQVADFVKRTYSSIWKVQLWSDSEIVLYWIRNLTQKQCVFVSNRTRTIKDHGFPFRYVPTKDNPADLPSRGSDTATLQSSIWWNGPLWLRQTEDNWPKDVISAPSNIATVNSIERSDTVHQIVTKVTIQQNESPFGIEINRFSSLSKLLRVTSLCSRFIQRLRNQHLIVGSVTAEEYIASRKLWLQFVQREHFQDQLDLLQKNRSDSTIHSMRLFLDDGLLKCRGRFSNADLSTDANNPILLPKKDTLTDLIILDQHTRLYHQGVRHTLSALRHMFWIPTGRQQVRFVLKKCRTCRRWDGTAYSNPPPPPLPKLRVTKNPAFTYTGCDFAGPLFIFDNGISKKTYICLFTCAVTRAVHLELVEDMTTQCFIMALRRFISRRGTPQEIISDNAKTFKLCKLVIDRLWHSIVISDDTINYVAKQGIKWKFNVERAPWWGGFFEKMVGLTKRTLLKAIGKSRLTNIELSTVLTEVEAILNSRPLTYVHDDLCDGSPLSPCNFLSEATSFALPLSVPDPDPEYNDPSASTSALIHKLRIKQLALDRFWKIWLNDYLPSLREVHLQRQKAPRKNPYTPRIGAVVLIKQDGVKRAYWKLGIVQYLYPGKDGEIRAVQLRCKDGQLLQRPISLLYPLEIESTDTMVNKRSDDKSQPKKQRNAALKAKERIKQAFTDTED